MAKNTNSKRAERMGKNNRNLNLAMKLLTVGFLAASALFAAGILIFVLAG